MTRKAELAKIVSSGNVIDDPDTLATYSCAQSFVRPVRPGYVVRPRNTDEVQALVKWANETLTPLVPVSSGPPRFRGNTVPGTDGAVIVDLTGMNKIRRIDRRNKVAMVEAGITFSELEPELEKEGLRLNIPLLPRSSKSVIGSMLEREPVIMPLSQWDIQDPLLCIEVIFGNGDLFRTGSAAGLAGVEDQWRRGQAQVSSMGPGQTDFARVVQGSQGTMGIVTWATIKCELSPTREKPFWLGSDSLQKLSEFIYRMMWLRLGNIWLVLNSSNLARILAKDPEEFIRLRSAFPSWVLFFSLAGFENFPEERIEYQEKDIADAAGRLGVEPVDTISGLSAYELLGRLGKPSEEPYWKIRYKRGCQDIFFLTTLDRVPEFVTVMYDMAEQSGYPSSDIGIYVQPMVQGTSCHCEFNLFYEPTDVREAARVQELYYLASQALMDAGAFFSRPYGALAELAYRRDGETTAALRKVKAIFDPNNVMNPGKLCF